MADCRRYFGAAKDLPGVRELFESHGMCYARALVVAYACVAVDTGKKRKTRGELYTLVDAGATLRPTLTALFTNCHRLLRLPG